MRNIKLIRVTEVMAMTGTGRTKHFADVRDGLLPPPIRRGIRYSRWLNHEITEVIDARVAGKDDTAVRLVVQRLIAARGGSPAHV